ncbi:LytTR family DNA-binding domain-containing protein [Mucilaginibacter sp. KACC 22773]|uniref:LytR/AlgR family response regulator transcription factor n=1 Tax=Mucilaginibacter sp. KACC 22773 TaxID=3025671 RepID=UPI002367369A|nr:LytTR family DNA-binding domain-containing protein [Mucilaginibacter sp. KACC 22773]WDF77692.1 LytTR family DNA-binding domain-containing protein [Mucilaginibacter sp. KACC 22773]
MNCYIIDDELHSIDTIKGYILKSDKLQFAGSSTNPVRGQSEINSRDDVDLVFIDIDMPDVSGLELTKLIPSEIAVIFISAHHKYAVDAFELNVVDFLLKPISLPRFLKAIQKVETVKGALLKDTYRSSDSLFISPGTRGKVIQVHLNQIVYIEGLKNYVIVHLTSEEKHITYLTMSEIEMALPQVQFIRIHKSFIVNKSMIQSIEGNMITVNSKIQLPLGHTYKDKFKDIIGMIMLKSKR